MSQIQGVTADPLLPHFSINPKKQPTILLHGAFASKDTWKPVHTHLSEYHLLIPTLPGHHESSKIPGIGELTLQNTSRLLHQLVAAEAHSGQAHVVGHSFGANVALHFISHYPDQILSVFVSGIAGFIRSSLTPYALWFDGIVSFAMPRSLLGYLIDADPDVQETASFGGFRSVKLCTSINNILMIPVEDELLIPAAAPEELKKRRVRVLTVAATKRGVLPSNDNVVRAKAVAGRLGGVAVEVPTMRHAWFLQDPGLFSRTVVAWVERAGLPTECIPL